MRFEPYTLYGRWAVGPAGVSVWGEFDPVANEKGEESQEEGMRRSFESLRSAFPSCVLLFDGPVPPKYAAHVAATLSSRFALDQHNGRWVHGGPWEVHLLESAGLASLNLFDLIETDDGGRGVAALFSPDRGNLPRYREALLASKDDGELQRALLATATAFLGLDHEAFFTFESLDPALGEQVVRAGRPAPPVRETPPHRDPAIPL